MQDHDATTPRPTRPVAPRSRILAAVAAIAVLAVAVATAPEPDGGAPATTATRTTDPDVFEPVTPTTAAVDFDHPASPTPPTDVLRGLAFEDVTVDAGLAVDRLGREITTGEDMSGGAAVADVDDDGDLDLYVPRIGRPNSLYRNDGDSTFTDVARDLGVRGTDWVTGYSGAVFADIDGDDDLDLLVTSVGGAEPLLYVQADDGTFTDEAAERGVTVDASGAVPPRIFSATFADWDGNGTLDLALGDWYGGPVAALANGEVARLPTGESERLGNDQCARNEVIAEHGFQTTEGFGPPQTKLLRNDGDGRFTDVTETSGIDPASLAAFTLTFADHDDDGDPDLFVAGDFCTSRLYRNDGDSRFVDVTRESGVGTDENGMGQAIEDLDGDGDLDWFVSGISFPASVGPCPSEAPTIGCSGNRAYLNRGDGTFADATDALGVRDAGWGWGVVAQDLTNTGTTDLAVASGWAQAGLTTEAYQDPVHLVHRRSASAPSSLWLPTGHGPWAEAADAVGFTDRGNGKTLLAFDLDRDGRLDLLKVNTETPLVLLRNATPSGPDRHWLGIRLHDVGSANTRGIGARVVVRAGDGSRRVAEVRAGGTFQGSGADELHVGLGAVRRPITVEVRWPGGTAVERYRIDAVDRMVDLDRGAGS